jgi:hypothetical protein
MEFSLLLFKIIACENLRNNFMNIITEIQYTDMPVHLSDPSPTSDAREAAHDAVVTQYSAPYNMGS